MAGFSDYLENEILDHVFGVGSYTSPTIGDTVSFAEGALDVTLD